MPDASSLTIRPAAWALIVAVTIGGGFYIYGKKLDIRAPQENPMVISVSGEGKVSAPPDIALLNFGVQTGRQPTAKAAIALIAKNMTAVIDAVKKLGVEEKDIATQQFWLSPAYDYVDGRQVPRGFEATQSVRVKVHDLDKAGDVLTAATTAGANQAGGIDFTIDNPDSLQAQARQKAIDDAKEKAQVLARSLGMSIVRMTGFSEGGNFRAPMPYAAKTMMAGAVAEDVASVPVPAGEQDITVSVSLSYELR